MLADLHNAVVTDVDVTDACRRTARRLATRRLALDQAAALRCQLNFYEPVFRGRDTVDEAVSPKRFRDSFDRVPLFGVHTHLGGDRFGVREALTSVFSIPDCVQETQSQFLYFADLFFIGHGIGRKYAEPRRMKPNPGPVLDAVRALGGAPKSCVLVGDSLSDIEAARAAGVAAIGYANKPWKVDAFATADLVVTSMGDIADALSPVSLVSPVSPGGD
jgi:hypothetical protein